MPRIALLGYFNVRNAGDDRLREVWARLFEGSRISAINYVGISRRTLAAYDFVAIGGGSIINNDNSIFNDHKSFRPRFGKARMGVAGVGVTGNFDLSNSPNIRSFADYCEFFLVRDQFSFASLGGANIEIAPDLSWIYPIPSETVDVDKELAVSLAPAPWFPEFRPSEWQRVLAKYDTIPWPFYFAKQTDTELLRDVLASDTQSEFSRLPLYRSRIVVAARYHAVQFALQLRRPFVAVAYATKVRNFMNDVGLSDLCLEVGEAHKLDEKIELIDRNYEKVVARLDVVASKLEVEAKAVGKRLRSIVMDDRSS